MNDTTTAIVSLIITALVAGPGVWWMCIHDWTTGPEDDSMI